MDSPSIERRGRDYTVSFAVAGSILDNCQTPELRSYLAGQIARCAAIFSIDEVIVFNDQQGKAGSSVAISVQVHLTASGLMLVCFRTKPWIAGTQTVVLAVGQDPTISRMPAVLAQNLLSTPLGP